MREFTRLQIERFAALAERFPACPRHLANSAGALRFPEARFDAVRCGIAVYGISPFGADPDADGIAPALRLESQVADVKLLQPGESAGLRPPLRRGRADLDRARPGRATPTAFRGCSRGRRTCSSAGAGAAWRPR